MSGEIQKQFVLTSKIGNGNFSTVYLAKHIQTQQIVAIKTMKNHIPIAVKQAQILKKMNHPNVIKLFKFQKPKNKEQALMVLQYLPQNILQLYEAQQYGLKEEQVKCILFQACMGLYHIHQKGIIHRDIKPQNIMINRNKAQVKLIDFGHAIQQTHCITDYVATRWYRAPQNLLGTKQYTVAIDIFSLGCVIVQLYTGNPLFPGSNNIDQISKIIQMMGEPTAYSWRKGYEMFIKLGMNFHIKSDKRSKNLKNLMTSCSEGLIKLIERMLVLNPFKRITAQQLLRDSYFNDIQKIIPPHVYEKYLMDIKNNIRTSFIRQAPKLESKIQTKQRVRFLSQEKGFGAFSSFKSGSASNKLENLLLTTNKSKQKHLNTTIQIKKSSLGQSVENFTKKNANLTPFSPSIRQSRQLSINKSQQNLIDQQKDNNKFSHGQMPTNIKNSIENYEKNLSKLSASLQNMKSLNKFQNLQVQKKQNQKIITKQNCKSSQMLSFRGFNQPKQRNQPVKQSTSFLPKKNQSQKHFPIKSKKVIEYLQKFQNYPTKKQQNYQQYQKKQSQSFLNQQMKVNRSVQKKSSFRIFDSQNKSFLTKNSFQFEEKQKQDNRLSETGTYQSKKENESFYQTKQILSSQGLYPYKNDFDPIQRHNYTNIQKIQRSENYRYEMNSPSIQKSYRSEIAKTLESPMKKINPILKIKFNHSDSKTYLFQNESLKPQKPVIPSNQSSGFLPEKNFMISPSKKSQNYQKESSQNFTNLQNNFYNQTRFSNGQLMNISSSRPIENKIKMVALRQGVTSENPNDWRNKQKTSNYSYMNPNQQKYIKSPFKNQPTFESNLKFSKNNITDQIILTNNYSSFHSPKNEQRNFQSPYKYLRNQIQTHNEPKEFLNQSHQKMKYFKSIYHPEVTSYKSPERYSIKNSKQTRNQTHYNFSSIEPKNSSLIDLNHHPHIDTNKYVPMHQYSASQFKHQNYLAQKPPQTTLSQLRESITGLTKSLNENAFLSERSQKYTNKNININLNLNIFQQKSHRKK